MDFKVVLVNLLTKINDQLNRFYQTKLIENSKVILRIQEGQSCFRISWRLYSLLGQRGEVMPLLVIVISLCSISNHKLVNLFLTFL